MSVVDAPASPRRPTRREVFEASFSGAQTRPFIPRLRSDPPSYQPLPHNLVEFREQEGQESRTSRLRQLWLTLPKDVRINHAEAEDEQVAREFAVDGDQSLTRERAERLQEMYQDELFSRCRTHTTELLHRNIGWVEFEKYAEAKEAGACPCSCLTCVHSEITSFADDASSAI